MLENVDAIRILDKYVNFFMDGMGGFNLSAIFLALQHENQMHLMEKILIYLLAAVKERTRKREPVKQFKNKRGRK